MVDEPRRNKVDETNDLLSSILEIGQQMIEVITVIADNLRYPEIIIDEPETSMKTLPNSEKYLETPDVDEGPPRQSPEREVWNVKQRYAREQDIKLSDKTAQLIIIAEGIGLTAIIGPDGSVAADFEVLRIWEQNYGKKILPQDETFSASGEGA